MKTQSRRTLIIAGGGVAVVAAAVAVYFIFLSGPPAPTKGAVALPKTVKARIGVKDNSTKAKGFSPDNKTDNKTTDNRTSVMPKTAQAAVAPDNATPAGQASNQGNYTYTASSMRDPFMPLIILKSEAEKKKGGSPIEDYEVSDFKLIAILWNKTAYYAMITLPDGKSYTIKTGAKLGINGGKVYKITKDSVIITEPARDYRGAIVQKEIIIKLRKEEE